MPRILGRHELFPRVNHKSWLGSGSSLSSADSTTSSTLRKSTGSVNLSVHLSESHENASSSSGHHRRQGLTYDGERAPSEDDNAWGYYVDFIEDERTAVMDTTTNNKKVVLLETSMMELALKASSR